MKYKQIPVIKLIQYEYNCQIWQFGSLNMFVLQSSVCSIKPHRTARFWHFPVLKYETFFFYIFSIYFISFYSAQNNKRNSRWYRWQTFIWYFHVNHRSEWVTGAVRGGLKSKTFYLAIFFLEFKFREYCLPSTKES